MLGYLVGASEKTAVGARVGSIVVVFKVGCKDGWDVGHLTGNPIGCREGFLVGQLQGARLGCAKGCVLGLKKGCRDGNIPIGFWDGRQVGRLDG